MPRGSGMPSNTRLMSISSFAAMLAQSDESSFAPWSLTREVGPKQPEQGMLPLTQSAPQPPLVAGPQQTRPCASRHFPGSISVSCGRLNSAKLRSAGFVALRGHSSHSAMSGASTLPFGGGSADNSAVSAACVRFGVGGQPGM